ncbi:MAG: hypothetical protein ACRD3T_00580 [Terriglobia bacterium]
MSKGKAWARSGILLTLVLLCLGAPPLSAANETRDPKAVEIDNTMMKAMGGEDAWNAAHFVRFEFKVRVKGKVVGDNFHLWDRKDGRYRLERAFPTGKHEVDLFNIGDYQNDKKGEAYLNGKKLEGEAAQKALENAYASYINDTWWLCMPWKWQATGVNLKYLGPKNRGAEAFDVIELTFNHVGLTPGDMYHAYVSQKSHLMTYWEYTLQSHDKGAWTWQYGDYHGVKLAKNHVSSDGSATINMGKVQVLDAVDDAYFTNPDHMLSGLK